MNSKIIFLILILGYNISWAQTNPKTAKKEELSQMEKMMIEQMKQEGASQKEIDETLADMRKMKSGDFGMTDEDKKMMDSLGISMPDLSKIEKDMNTISSADLKEALEDENRIVPKKDVKSIALISPNPLTGSTINSFIQKTFSDVNKIFTKDEISSFEEIYQFGIKNTQNQNDINGMASELWLLKKQKAALYLQGKICMADFKNDNNLNNYAAFLSMLGGEQYAIPILNYLLEKYPNNSTIVNNLAEAWFGLGDMDKAEKYADKALFLYAGHPQANIIKSKIEENKSHKQKAIEYAKKAIEKNYSTSKEDRLKKLGYELTSNDITLPTKPKNDPFGLGKFTYPKFPLTAEEEVYLKKEWETFHDELENEITKLNLKLQEAERISEQKQQERQNKLLKISQLAIKMGKPLSPNFAVIPLYASKGAKLLKNDGVVFPTKDYLTDFELNKAIPAKKNYEKEMEALRKKDFEQTGEGKPNVDFCPQYAALVTKYLSGINPDYESIQVERLRNHRIFLDQEVYKWQYVLWEDQFEVAKIKAQLDWLGSLQTLNYKYTGHFTEETLCKKKSNTPKQNKLANFNDVHCEYKSEFDWYFMKMKSDCDKITTKFKFELFNVKAFEAEINQDLSQVKDWNQDWWMTTADAFVNCTIEAGVSKSAEIGSGPLKLEAEVEVAGVLEIDRSGISDVGVKVTGEIKVGTNTGDLGNVPEPSENVSNIDVTVIGAEAKITVNSGFSAEGKGVLKGLKR